MTPTCLDKTNTSVSSTVTRSSAPKQHAAYKLLHLNYSTSLQQQSVAAANGTDSFRFR